MSQEQNIADAKSAFVSGQDSLVNQVFTDLANKERAEGVASVPPADAEEQVKIDAAVAAQKAADQVVIDGLNQQVADLTAKDAGDVQALTDAQAAMADLKSKFDTLAQKENIESSVIASLQGSLSQLQSAVSILSNLPLPAQP